MSEMKIGVNVDTGDQVTINLEKFIDTRAILTASSGGGKSWGVRKFLQESYGKVQQIILDWEGEYSNLRPEFDYLLVGDDGEIPIQVKTAELLAKKIMQLSVSTIIDLSDLTIHDRKLFTRNFLDSLLNLPKEMYNHSVLLFIDEAHLLCLSEDTEILTDEGWKKYNEISVGDIAFSYNKEKGIYELNTIEDIIIKKFKGDINKLFNEDSIDCLSTDDHRTLCKTRITKPGRKFGWSNEKFVQTKDLPTGIKIPITAKLNNRSSCKISDNMLSLLGWIITDGNKHSGKYYQICQATSNPCKPFLYKKMKDVITTEYPRAKIYLREKRQGHKESAMFNLGVVASKKIDVWLKGETHRIPRDLLSNASSDQLKKLFIAMIEGDGTTNKNKFNNTYFFAGYNEPLSDDFQELCIRLGYSAIKKINKKNKQITVAVSFKRKYASVRKIEKEEYSGLVWDITIDNGAFVCRRNGKPFITGNCPQKGNSESMNSVINVNSTGRKRGIGTVLCTQRIAKLNKDAVAESRNGAMGGMGLLEDRKRACDEMGFNTKGLEQSIKLLDTGVFYMYGPAISKEVIPVKIGDVRIKPPKPGQKLIANDKTPEAIKKILQSLTDLPKEAEKELKSKEDMKKKIIELNTELRRRPTETKIKEVIKVDEVALEKSKMRGFKEAEIGYEKKIKVLESSFKKKIIEVDTFHKKNNIITSNELNKLKQKMNKISQIATGENNVRVEYPAEESKEISLKVEIPEMQVTAPKIDHQISAPVQVQKQTPSPESTGAELYDEHGEPVKLTLCARKIYSFLFANPDREFSRVQLATITGYSHKSGGFGDAVSKLNVMNLIQKNGVLIKLGTVESSVATENSSELSIESWFNRLNKCARTILKLLIDNPYESFNRPDIAEKTGYSSGSGGFGDAISKLNVLGMLVKEGTLIKINPDILEL